MKRRDLLWFDGSAAAVAGLLTLKLADWLSDWYQLPERFLVAIGLVNVAYAWYSLLLARRAERPMAFIVLLVVGNSTWAILCLRWAYVFRESASLYGLTHLVVEGLFVGGLACLEWRWREDLKRRREA